MRTRALALLATLAPAPAAGPVPGNPEPAAPPAPAWAPPAANAAPDVRWGRKKLNLRRLPDDLQGAALDAVTRWGEWADGVDYSLHLSEDGRVLVVGYKRTVVSKQLDLALETVERFDELILSPEEAPPVGGEEPEDGEASPGEAVAAVPDDPADDAPFFEELPFGDLGARPERAAPTEAAPVEEDLFVPNSHTAVMVLCEEQEGYEALLDEMARRDPDLRNWAAEARFQGGFLLTDPPVGSFVLLAEGREEFNPDNELVNRVAQMMLVRRFGKHVPFWVLQGFAWRVETDVEGTVYCFPYRDGFVGSDDHSGWGIALANIFRSKDRDGRPLSVLDFAHWRRGSYNDDYAKISWGLVTWLCEEDPEAFTRFLDELRVYAHENNRRGIGEGRWERIANWEVPIEVQEETLEKLYGEDLWERATEDFEKRRIE